MGLRNDKERKGKKRNEKGKKRNDFLRNSPIFSDFLQNSLIFSGNDHENDRK